MLCHQITSNEATIFKDAYDTCQVEGGSLPFAASGTEEMHLKGSLIINCKVLVKSWNTHFASGLSTKQWLGITDLNSKGTWMTTDGHLSKTVYQSSNVV